jgi:hypothetical protein
MWVCAKLGFFSIVKKGEPGTWQIRTRAEHDLHELLAASHLDAEIISTPKADYAFRIVVDKGALDRIFAVLADSVDYSNFKSCIASLPQQRDKLSAYNEFWGRMGNLQQKGLRPLTSKRREPEPRTKEQIVKEYQGYLIRMLKTIGGFKAKHGQWPTRLRLAADAFRLLENSALTPFGFQLLTAKLQLVADDIDTLIAEDDNGLRLEYGEENPSEGDLFGGADEWVWGVKVN